MPNCQVLLVEDNPGDVLLTQQILQASSLTHDLYVVRDGVDALAFLRHEADHTDAVRPHVILLDLNLPRKTGHEVLAEIKADPDLKRIPVIVLSTSDADTDVLTSYELHANCYVVKPNDIDQFASAVRSIENFWLTIANLPGRQGM